MSDRIFLDTNVLVYLYDEDTPEKQARSASLLEEHGLAGSIFLSTQVLQEFYVTVTRKLARPLSGELALLAVKSLDKFPTVGIDVSLVHAAISFSQNHRISFWDGLVVQAALQAGCTRLLTEDLHDGWRIGNLRVENPYATH
jgi:predicted nucleic acid-binding protein